MVLVTNNLKVIMIYITQHCKINKNEVTCQGDQDFDIGQVMARTW